MTEKSLLVGQNGTWIYNCHKNKSSALCIWNEIFGNFQIFRFSCSQFGFSWHV